jgi:hypothetical protein
MKVHVEYIMRWQAIFSIQLGGDFESTKISPTETIFGQGPIDLAIGTPIFIEQGSKALHWLCSGGPRSSVSGPNQ